MAYFNLYLSGLMRKTHKNRKQLLMAYGLQTAAAFLFSLIAFIVVGIQYPFWKALLVGVFSLVPVIGNGIIYIPWIIARFVGNEWTICGRLALIYVLTLVLIQFAEPILIGTNKGLRPVLAFVFFAFCYFIGFIKGALIASVIIGIVKALLDAVDVQNIIRRTKVRQSRQNFEKKEFQKHHDIKDVSILYDEKPEGKGEYHLDDVLDDDERKKIKEAHEFTQKQNFKTTDLNDNSDEDEK